MKRFFAVVATALVLIHVAVDNIIACPACKDSFTNGGANGSVGEAYSWSILFMLGVPLIIITVATIVVARRLRQYPNSIL